MENNREHRAAWIQEAMEKYHRPLTRYAQRFTGDLERARDMVQETFLQLCRSDPARVRTHLGAWLFAVCRNRALSLQRKESRMTTLSEMGACDRPSPLPGPAELVEVDEQARRVLDALGSLPERQQEIVRLKFQEELSYREIGEITGLSASNVGFLLHAALKSIRQHLGAEALSSPITMRRVK